MATQAALQQVTLTTEELKTFLTHIVNNNRLLQADGKPSVAVEIEGESGIGKTSAAIQLAEELKMNMVKLNLAQIEELGDLVGYPVRQFQLCKPVEGGSDPLMSHSVEKTIQVPEVRKVIKQVEELVDMPRTVSKQVMGADGKLTMQNVTVMTKVKKLVDKEVEETVMVDKTVSEPVTVWVESELSRGECLWIDEQAVTEYTKQGYRFTGEKRMSYCPPEWIADKQGGGFLLLDDWNRADIRFIQAVMELVDRGEYISWKLPKDWHILLTANPDNGEYLVQSIDVAQRTRFVKTKLKFDVETWARWAEIEKIDSRCINFLLLNPELVSVSINPRSITTFFNAISSIKDFSKDLPLVQMIGEGSVGPEFTTTFCMFINNKLDKLVSPREMLLGAVDNTVLGDLRACIGALNSADYRADIAAVLTTRLINWTVTYAENNPITQKEINRLILLATDPDTFSDDLKYIIVKKILNGNKQKFQKMMLDPEVIKMSMK